MIELDNTTRKELRRIQKSNRDKRVFVKVTVLLMLDQGFHPADVATALGIDESTVYRYQKIYLDQGLQDFLSANYQAYNGKLTDRELAILKQELIDQLYLSSREVAHIIKHRFKKHYTTDGVVKLLHRLGFVYKKTKTVPAKANPDAQEQFLAELTHLLADLKDDEIVYFNDAVHPLHNTRPDYGWIPIGWASKLPANSGRNRLNLNGALNACDVTDILIREDDRINAQSTIHLWESQHKRHPGKTIYNIVDNARYYHSRVLKEWLQAHTWCNVIYLPPYSPNLNLIERLWKLLRKEVISYYYYEHYSDFRKAVLNFFRNIKKYEPQLTTLLTLKFNIQAVD